MAGLWTYPTLRPFKLFQNRQNVILINVDDLCMGKNAKALSGDISEVVLSVSIKDENTVAICVCVAELMI